MMDALIKQLPALVVICPLLVAPLLIIIKHRLWVRALTLVALGASMCCAFTLLGLSATESVHYNMGGWAVPLGIEYRIDALSALTLTLITTIGFISAWVGLSGSGISIREERAHFFAVAFLLCFAGLCGMAATGDAFNFFVFLEISSLSSYALVSMGMHRRALRAAFTYLVLGTIGGTFILIGIGLAYQLTGTLNFDDLASRLKAVDGIATKQVAFAFFFVGLAIKLAVFPVHQWLPGAYGEAPSAVSGFLAGTSTKVIFAAFVRVIFVLFGTQFAFGELHFDKVLIALSLAAMFIGSAAAIYQQRLKRLLAYSSIAQIGYLTLGLALDSPQGVSASLMHMVNHGLTKAALFLAAACALHRVGSDKLSELNGLHKRMPLTHGLLLLGMLGLIGIPGTACFSSKWLLLVATLDAGQTWLAFAIGFSSLLALAYGFRVVQHTYFGQAQQAEHDARSRPHGWKSEFAFGGTHLLLPALVCAGLTLVLGIFPDPLYDIALAATAELGVTP